MGQRAPTRKKYQICKQVAFLLLNSSLTNWSWPGQPDVLLIVCHPIMEQGNIVVQDNKTFGPCACLQRSPGPGEVPRVTSLHQLGNQLGAQEKSTHVSLHKPSHMPVLAAFEIAPTPSSARHTVDPLVWFMVNLFLTGSDFPSSSTA